MPENRQFRTTANGQYRTFEVRSSWIDEWDAVAQLGERRVRNTKVGSSILLGSTNCIERPDSGAGIVGR